MAVDLVRAACTYCRGGTRRTMRLGFEANSDGELDHRMSFRNQPRTCNHHLLRTPSDLIRDIRPDFLLPSPPFFPLTLRLSSLLPLMLPLRRLPRSALARRAFSTSPRSQYWVSAGDQAIQNKPVLTVCAHPRYSLLCGSLTRSKKRSPRPSPSSPSRRCVATRFVLSLPARS